MNKIDTTKIFTNVKIILFFLYVLIFYMFGADSEKVRYSEIILVLFIGLEFIRIVKIKKMKYSIPIVIVFIFSLYCFLSNFWAINSELAINKSKTLFILSAFLLITYNFFIDIENSEEKLLKIIMWSGIIFSIYVILYYGTGEYFTKLMNGARVGEEINNVNTIGLQTSISFVIAIFYALYNKKKRYLLFSVIPLIVSLGTGSRKVIILIAIETILLFILKKETKIDILKLTKKMLLFICIICMFIYIAQMPIFSTVFERLQMSINIFTGKGKVDNSTAERMLFVKAGIDQFFEKPILGIGIGNSSYITLDVAGWSTYLHNNFVELLATTGIVGFTLYYSVYFYIIINCIKLLNKKNKYINIVLVIFITNLILEYGMVSYYEKSTYVYMLLALITIGKVKNEV